MVELHQSGDLRPDEMITTTCTLDEVDQGYEDLVAGKDIRGVVLFDTPPPEGAPA
jgi:S-(hydroxymethyl)glutathione dehydrogenase/alcohol dehydrogenase